MTEEACFPGLYSSWSPNSQKKNLPVFVNYKHTGDKYIYDIEKLFQYIIDNVFSGTFLYLFTFLHVSVQKPAMSLSYTTDGFWNFSIHEEKSIQPYFEGPCK